MNNMKKMGLDPECFDLSKYLKIIKRKEEKEHDKRKRNLKRDGRKN